MSYLPRKRGARPLLKWVTIGAGSALIMVTQGSWSSKEENRFAEKTSQQDLVRTGHASVAQKMANRANDNQNQDQQVSGLEAELLAQVWGGEKHSHGEEAGPSELQLDRLARFASVPLHFGLEQSSSDPAKREILAFARHWAAEHGIEASYSEVSHQSYPSGQWIQPEAYYELPQMSGAYPIEGASLQVMVKQSQGQARVVYLDAAQARLPQGFRAEAHLTSAQALLLARQKTQQMETEVMENRDSIDRLAGKYRLLKTVRFMGHSHTARIDLKTGEVWTFDSTVSFGGSRTPELPQAVSSERVLLTVKGRGIEGDPSSSQSQLEELPLRHLRVDASGNNFFTNQQGEVQLPTLGRADVSVAAGMVGKFAEVVDAGQKDMRIAGQVSTLEPARAIFNSRGFDEGKTAQITAYYHQGLIHDWLTSRGLNAPLINYPTKVRVNLGPEHMKKQCNANYFAGSLNFFRSDKVCRGQFCIECRNSAFNDIVYHEYGHLVDDAYGRIMDGGLSEGWGDVLALMMTDDPQLGENFLSTGRPIRNADNTYVYQVEKDPHRMGMALSGFAWQLRLQLIDKYGEAKGKKMLEDLLLPSIVSNARDIPAVIAQVYARDDDDADLSNETPHAKEIRGAASRHGLESFLEPSEELLVAKE